MIKFNQFIQKYIPIALLFVILWIFVAPLILLLLPRLSFSDSGQIGDTIGGLTTPIIGLLSALLLYLTLTKQIESNKISEANSKRAEDESNFRMVFGEFYEFRKDIEKYQFKDKDGNDAIEKFITQTISNAKMSVKISSYEELDKYDRLLSRFDRVLYLKEEFHTSKKQTEFLETEMEEIFHVYFSGVSFAANIHWDVSEKDIHDWENGKAYIIKQHINKIYERIYQISPTY